MRKPLFNTFVFAVALVLGVTSCNIFASPETETLQEEITGGTANISIFVPDYYAMANTERVILPATSRIKFSYYSSRTSSWINHATVDLSTIAKIPLDGVPSDFPGSVYNVTFNNIPSATYAAGKLRVDLLDASDNILSGGTNAEAADIVIGETETVTFFTTPADSLVNSTGMLSNGEMKFYTFKIWAGKTYSLKVNVAEGNKYPDVVIFDSKWKLSKYYVIDDAASSSITFEEERENGLKYVAVWADDGEAISNYELVVTATGTATDATDISVFNEKGFGSGTIIDSSWELKTTVSANYAESAKPKLVELFGDNSGDGYALKFDFMKTRGATSTISKKILLEEAKTISFSVKTDIYAQYDGYLCFYIDDVKQDSYTGKNGAWTIYNYDISEGEHVIKWVAEDPSSSYTTGITNTVYVDSLRLKAATEYPMSLNMDFEDSLNSDIFTGIGPEATIVANDPCFAKWTQYGNALVDTHGKVYKLCHYTDRTYGPAKLQFKVKPTVESAVSFDYKSDIYNTSTFKVFVDGIEKSSVSGSSSGQGTMWRSQSIVVEAGLHTVILEVAPNSSNNYGPNITNAVYIDNLTLVPNTISSVDISPKGLQETYVGGFPIQFTAKALRSDGTEITGKTVTWTGASTEGVFTPSAEGISTVTATIEGKSASNSTVKVHSADYLSDAVTLAGKTFTGKISSGSGRVTDTVTVSWESPTPAYTSFSADGFFVVKGKTTAKNGTKNWTSTALMEIEKGDRKTYVYLKDEFYERVWLRFGSGTYTIRVYDTTITYNNTGDSKYQGDRSTSSYSLSTSPLVLTVNNTNTSLTANDAVTLLPSAWCQSDDFLISNAATAVISELPADATVGQKLAALHDWEIRRMHYDYVSFNHDSQRKAQDAKHVVEYAMGVCEGYANLFTALERCIGVKGRVISSRETNHAWNNSYYNNEWLLIDPTWDDPSSGSSSDSNVEKNPTAENYKYFLLTKAQDSATTKSHMSYAITATENNQIGGDGINIGRSADILEVPQPLVLHGMPDGWY